LLSPIKQRRLAFSFGVVGAISFWLPDLVVHIATGRNFDSPHARAITVLMPLTFLFAYLVCRGLAVRRDFNWAGATMLLGVWLTAGLFMTLAATASGGGFAGPDGVPGGLLLTVLCIFPPITLMFATYDGGGLALLAVTIGGLLFWAVQSGEIRPPFRRPPK
jgi:hypothetical protein